MSIKVDIAVDFTSLADKSQALRITPMDEGVTGFDYEQGFKPFAPESELQIEHPFLMSVDEYDRRNPD